jgi:acetylcholinesterase
MLPSATKEEVDLLLYHYPDDPKAGCPFDTGLRNMLGTFVADFPCHGLELNPRPGPQFKRIAAIQGDVVFHGPRRFFLKYRGGKQRSWAFSVSDLSTQVISHSITFSS